jgi:hypothetical protein
MSNRVIERVSSSFIQVGQIIVASIDLVRWGGALVEPAAPKFDGMSNMANVPEMGSRLEGYNAPSGNLGTWDMLREGITDITSTYLGFLDVIPYGKFNETPPVLVDGQGVPLQQDVNGNLKVTAVVPTVGTEGNAWLNAAVGAGATSASIDTQFTPFVSIFGTADGATTITIQFSQDNVNFYNDSSFTVVGPTFNFGVNQTIGARYVRLRTSNAVTITATIAAKGG